MHNGCPENKAQTIPAMDELISISTTPNELLVPSWKSNPKAIAGDKQAKNKKRMEDDVLTTFSPLNASVQSLPYIFARLRMSALMPPANL
jgi:hypothetical protein